eukprot:GFYU01032743.1.p1 GENE.GFYU01032743.1~~GFYU01032743.1.p1  ORF type:complete len:346 (+),score=93.27 GFYU01032743.1:53-1090(+)
MHRFQAAFTKGLRASSLTYNPQTKTGFIIYQASAAASVRVQANASPMGRRDFSTTAFRFNSAANAPAATTISPPNRKLKIAIIGQENFGAAVMKRLRREGHEIVGVFTPPQKGNRKDPLALAAEEYGIPLVQPKRWQRKGVVDQDVFDQYAAVNADLNVMAFVSQLIPMSVINHPPMKTIQYHPSVLPKRRGRSAINHAIVNGDAMIGFSIFWPDDGLDTGPILLQKSVPIKENDTQMSLYTDFLYPQGVEGMVEAVNLVAGGLAPKFVQDESEATYEGPWEKDIAHIDWSNASDAIHDFIRGSDRLPGAWTELNGEKVFLYGSRKTFDDAGDILGEVDFGLRDR